MPEESSNDSANETRADQKAKGRYEGCGREARRIGNPREPSEFQAIAKSDAKYFPAVAYGGVKLAEGPTANSN